MDFAIILENWQVFALGVWNTIWLVGLSLLFGGLLAIPLALSQAYKIPVLGNLSFVYSYGIRGTPLLVQLYIIYYGLWAV